MQIVHTDAVLRDAATQYVVQTFRQHLDRVGVYGGRWNKQAAAVGGRFGRELHELSGNAFGLQAA